MQSLSQYFFIMILLTNRLRLRPWEAPDFTSFATMNCDAQVMEFFPNLLSEQDSNKLAERISKHIEEHGWGLWAAERRDTNEFIGYIGLNEPNFEASFTPCVEVGWRLKHDAWGYGFATEGARECLRFGFQELELSEIVSFTAKTNVRSIKVMERIGMKLDVNGEFNHPRLDPAHPLSRHALFRVGHRDLLKC